LDDLWVISSVAFSFAVALNWWSSFVFSSGSWLCYQHEIPLDIKTLRCILNLKTIGTMPILFQIDS
jgi:hypothetical protein